MNHEIKVWDEVICIDSTNSARLKKGKSYIVYGINDYYDLLIESTLGECYFYNKKFFIKKQNVIELW